MKRSGFVLLFLFFLSVMFVEFGSAEIITLIDNSKINGQVVHYYKGDMEVNVNGALMNLNRDKVKSILFEAPPADPQFSTSEKTFKLWENAMKTGDMDKIVECYAMLYQNLIRQQLDTLTADGKSKMKQDFADSEMSVVESRTDKYKVFLKINRKTAKKTESVELIFTNENNEWKMVPSL